MIKVLIAEDEKLAREELEYLLNQEDDIKLFPSAKNGIELLELVERYLPDVVFLDIQMPEMDGIEVASKLVTATSKPYIIFCTAYQEYAVDAFEFNAIDYLLKPYSPTRLKESINRIRERMLHQSTSTVKLEKIILEENNNLILVHPEEIIYAEKEDRRLVIHTNNRKIHSKMTLQELEKSVAKANFIKPHRSYLVNSNYVLELRPWINGAYNMVLKDKNETIIPIPRTAIKQVIQRLNHS